MQAVKTEVEVCHQTTSSTSPCDATRDDVNNAITAAVLVDSIASITVSDDGAGNYEIIATSAATDKIEAGETATLSGAGAGGAIRWDDLACTNGLC